MMTRLCGLMALGVAGFGAAAPATQVDAVGADPRIEIFSILFHLAGAPEYNRGRYPA